MNICEQLKPWMVETGFEEVQVVALKVCCRCPYPLCFYRNEHANI